MSLAHQLEPAGETAPVSEPTGTFDDGTFEELIDAQFAALAAGHEVPVADAAEVGRRAARAGCGARQLVAEHFAAVGRHPQAATLAPRIAAGLSAALAGWRSIAEAGGPATAGQDAPDPATAGSAPPGPGVDPEVIGAVRALDEGAREASGSAGGVSMSVRMVTGMMGEIVARIATTIDSVQQSRDVATGAMTEVSRTAGHVQELDGAVARINELAELIRSIARQSSLLSLNAMIEAARAGAAGAGFSVVAHEVKDLAKRTTQATEDIASALEAVVLAKTHVAQSVNLARDGFAAIQARVEVISGNVNEDKTVIDTIRTFIGDAADNVDQISSSLDQLASRAAAAATTLSTA